MAARILATSPLAALRAASIAPAVSRRAFTSAARCLNEAAPAAASSAGIAASAVGRASSKPVGGFRGGIFGFLLGSSVAAYGTWTYVLEEYRLSNELLTEDIYVRMCI